MAQNNKLNATAKVAQETLNTQNNIQSELYRQRGVIEGNIDRVKFKLFRPKISKLRFTKHQRQQMRCEHAIFV